MLTNIVVKFIKMKVTNYLTEQCDQPVDMFEKLNPNLRAIAVGVEDDDTIEVAIDKLLGSVITNTSFQLLKLVLLAAVFSPESNQELVATLRNLGPSVAGPIQKCIEEMTTDGEAIVSESPDEQRGTTIEASDGPIRAQDPQLLLEERLMQASNSAQDFQQRNVYLEKELEDAREQLKQLQQDATTNHQNKTQKTDLATVIQKLRDEHADNIALLEQELYNAQTKVTTQSKRLSKLATLEASRNKLQSDLDQLRDERDELEQKSNAGENLKKKVKALQEAQTHNDLLRQDYDLAQQELDELRPLRDQHTQLQRRLQELTQHFQSLEVSNEDDQRALERAENELSFLNQSLIESREQHQRDQEQLGEYQGRLRELESTHEDLSFASLDQELSTLESPPQSPESSVRPPTTPSTQIGRHYTSGSGSANSEVIVSQERPILPASPQFISSLAMSPRERFRQAQEMALLPTVPVLAHGLQARPRLSRGISVKMTIDVTQTRPRLPLQDPLPLQATSSLLKSWIPLHIFINLKAITNNPSQIFQIRTLRTRLAQAEASLAAINRTNEESPNSRTGNEALQTELDKMSDAWYDITRRLQSDAVVMQRRSEAPRSWLGKMRRVVGSTVRTVS